MSDETLLLEIVHTLEEHGLVRDEYQLHRVIDVEALEQLVNSTSPQTDLEVRFTVGEFRVLVVDSKVIVNRTSGD
ncbi:HalOD1 output domain-containing protein [Natrarchaeobius sp. A-rgal3]|uniref:HalOD1 output domain-containing protein n=1 Tax=Natrarchaeobius versutus TaxID=1679078 RepID=UPI00350F4D04